MFKRIIDWWNKYQDGRKVRKKELSHRAILELFASGDWKKDDNTALVMHFKVQDEYHKAYKQYYLKWGEKPRVENELLAHRIKC